MHPAFSLVPLALFACIAYAIRAVADARARTDMAKLASPEVVHTILRAEEAKRLKGGLRWGIVLTSIAIGLLIIELVGWDEPTPGALAVLVGATGIGNLVFFLLAPPLLSHILDR